MGAGTSGLQSASILTGAGRGRAFDELNDAAALRLLEEQKHVFADWSTVKQCLENGTTLQGRDRDILDALVELDARLDLVAYTTTAKRLLKDATNKVNPLEGWTPSVPQGDLLEAHSEQWRAMERIGLREVGKCAFVLVAGGLGERLGYDGIKVSLPTESTTGTCYLELYIKTILAFERRSGNTLPLCLMLSPVWKSTSVAGAPPRHRAGVASMAWRSNERAVNLISTQVIRGHGRRDTRPISRKQQLRHACRPNFLRRAGGRAGA
jgi:hypothetical protein